MVGLDVVFVVDTGKAYHPLQNNFYTATPSKVAKRKE
jgi:hypothetical protein